MDCFEESGGMIVEWEMFGFFKEEDMNESCGCICNFIVDVSYISGNFGFCFGVDCIFGGIIYIKWYEFFF